MALSLNKRQELVLSFLEQAQKPQAVSDVIQYIHTVGYIFSRMTIYRDLQELQGLGYIQKSGAGRGAVYATTQGYRAIRPIDVEKYFEKDLEKRHAKEVFDFDIFSLLESVFSSQELVHLKKANNVYTQNIQQLSPTVLKREYERLAIELSWKSSKIEGNTYTLLETEYLLREQQEPKGHTRSETNMILNHKIALDYIRAHKKRFVKLQVRDIEDVHSLLVENLGVSKNVRSGLVRITGTVYKPLDNVFQITEALEKACILINTQKNPLTKAFIAMLLIAYIQPFEDGNKRTSRLIGNALLIAHDVCPLSFRSIDELEYKKAMLLFYEQNNFRYFKELFIEQFEFSVNNYFGA
ncbi:MAG: Fic family protein [Candidatus Magasanikbacteria bacterium]|nr:Fic family protein [Candidatus Magasanikbacteria bacterium]